MEKCDGHSIYLNETPTTADKQNIQSDSSTEFVSLKLGSVRIHKSDFDALTRYFTKKDMVEEIRAEGLEGLYDFYRDLEKNRLDALVKDKAAQVA